MAWGNFHWTSFANDNSGGDYNSELFCVYWKQQQYNCLASTIFLDCCSQSSRFATVWPRDSIWKTLFGEEPGN